MSTSNQPSAEQIAFTKGLTHDLRLNTPTQFEVILQAVIRYDDFRRTQVETLQKQVQELASVRPPSIMIFGC